MKKNISGTKTEDATTELQESVLAAWISLNGMLKDSRMTKDMTYNEAIIMRLVLERYREDGIGLTPIQSVIRETHMLKSLVNRTVNTLCERGFLCRQRDPKDGRNLLIAPVQEKLPEFLRIHQASLDIAQEIIAVVGEEDARCFVRICEKLGSADIMLPTAAQKTTGSNQKIHL